jgi:hypothetical protein
MEAGRATTQKFVGFVWFAAIFLFSSCALSKTTYSGGDIYSYKSGPQFFGVIDNADALNGFFPEAVYIKTRFQTFNAYY